MMNFINIAYKIFSHTVLKLKKSRTIIYFSIIISLIFILLITMKINIYNSLGFYNDIFLLFYCTNGSFYNRNSSFHGGCTQKTSAQGKEKFQIWKVLLLKNRKKVQTKVRERRGVSENFAEVFCVRFSLKIQTLFDSKNIFFSIYTRIV